MDRRRLCCRAVLSAAGHASDRRLKRRESGDGSERHLCHHAGAGQPPGREASRVATPLPRTTDMPVLLGSSQAQVVTAQDGLRSIVPSAGNVARATVFITVTAGQSTAQFQMESLAAIATEPTKSKTKPPAAQPDPHFDSQNSTPPAASAALFAVPELAPVEPVPSPSTCSEAHSDSSSGTGDVASGSCASASEWPQVEDKATRPPVEPMPKTSNPMSKPKSKQMPKPPPKPVDASPAAENSAASWLLEDRRICRLAESGNAYLQFVAHNE